MNEQQEPKDSFKQRQRLILAYYKELDTRRNTLWEIFFARMASWLTICASILVLPTLLMGTHTLLYSAPLALLLLLLILAYELYRNQKRPPESHSS